ncbi:hypothetical protein MRX96_033843 [Rhipicephalus microplus]
MGSSGRGHIECRWDPGRLSAETLAPETTPKGSRGKGAIRIRTHTALALRSRGRPSWADPIAGPGGRFLQQNFHRPVVYVCVLSIYARVSYPPQPLVEAAGTSGSAAEAAANAVVSTLVAAVGTCFTREELSRAFGLLALIYGGKVSCCKRVLVAATARLCTDNLSRPPLLLHTTRYFASFAYSCPEQNSSWDHACMKERGDHGTGADRHAAALCSARARETNQQKDAQEKKCEVLAPRRRTSGAQLGRGTASEAFIIDSNDEVPSPALPPPPALEASPPPSASRRLFFLFQHTRFFFGRCSRCLFISPLRACSALRRALARSGPCVQTVSGHSLGRCLSLAQLVREPKNGLCAHHCSAACV